MKISELLMKEMDDASKDELKRNVDMAQHFMEVMVDTGFAARDVALAFIKAGVDMKLHVGGADLTKSILKAIQDLIDLHHAETEAPQQQLQES